MIRAVYLTFLMVCVVTTIAPAQDSGKPSGPSTPPEIGDPTAFFHKTVRGIPPLAYRQLDAASNARPQEMTAVRAWLDRYGTTLRDVRHGRLNVQTPGGTHLVSTDGRKIYLHILDHHASGQAIIYGLSEAGLEKAYWAGDEKTQLKHASTGRAVVIDVTKKNAPAPDPLDTVVVLEFSAEPKVVETMTIKPQADGTLVLHAKDAIVHGKNLRYEPEPNKNTLGYWTNPADYAVWKFQVDRAGEYDVEALQGCGKNSGGSEVEFIIDGQALPMVVQDTGHFQNFVPRPLGKVRLDGSAELTVRVKSKKGVAVMDLRQVTLKPVK